MHIMRMLATQHTTLLVIILPCILEKDTAVLYHRHAVIKPEVSSNYFHVAIVTRKE